MVENKCDYCFREISSQESPVKIEGRHFCCEKCGEYFSKRTKKDDRDRVFEMMAGTLAGSKKDKDPLSESVGCLAILVVLLIIASFNLFRGYATNASWVSTVGNLVSVQEKTKRTRRFRIKLYTTYEVNFAFSVNGKKYVGHDTLDEKPETQIVTVYYNPEHPTSNRIGEYKLSWNRMAGPSLLLGLCAWMAYRVIETRRRRRADVDPGL